MNNELKTDDLIVVTKGNYVCAPKGTVCRIQGFNGTISSTDGYQLDAIVEIMSGTFKGNDGYYVNIDDAVKVNLTKEDLYGKDDPNELRNTAIKLPEGTPIRQLDKTEHLSGGDGNNVKISKVSDDIDSAWYDKDDLVEDKVFDTTHELKPKKTFEIEGIMFPENLNEYNNPLDKNPWWKSDEELNKATVSMSYHSVKKDEGKFEEIGRTLGALVDKKQKAYGDSVSQASELMKVFLKNYDNGDNTYTLPKELVDEMLMMVRVIDKLNRIVANPKGDLMDESPWQDLAGYGLLAANMKKGE